MAPSRPSPQFTLMKVWESLYIIFRYIVLHIILYVFYSTRRIHTILYSISVNIRFLFHIIIVIFHLTRSSASSDSHIFGWTAP